MNQAFVQKTSPSVAIILVNWNSYEVSNDCILSLKKIDYPNYTIILVDNGSADGSGMKLREAHPDIVTILSDKNTGFTGGNNIGFRYSLDNHFDYSMMLNNDTFVEPDFLSKLIDLIETSDTIGAVQPRIHFDHNRQLLWNGGSYFNQFWGFTYTKGENKAPQKEHLINKEVDWITGCAFLVKNTVLQQVGLLAENMFMYSEDVDLSFRIRKKGHQLMYVADSLIFHIAGMSNKRKTKGKDGFVNPQVHYLNQRNRIWILKKYSKWPFALPTIIANFIYITLVLGYFTIRFRFRKMNAMVNAVKDGISGAIEYK